MNSYIRSFTIIMNCNHNHKSLMSNTVHYITIIISSKGDESPVPYERRLATLTKDFKTLAKEGFYAEERPDGLRCTFCGLTVRGQVDRHEDVSADHRRYASNRCPTLRRRDVATQTYSTSGQMCSVCMESKIDSVMIPCGHACSCMACAEEVMGNGCPVCRTETVRAVKLYITC